MNKMITYGFSIIAFFLITVAFNERESAKRAWLFLFASQFFFAVSIAFNDEFTSMQALLYLSGDVGCALLGYYCLHILEKKEGKSSLDKFYGHIYEHPRLGLVFLLSCLGMVGFPLTPSFIGVDLLFSHIHLNDVPLLMITASGFIVLEIAALRIYSRLFLGPHSKSYHETAFRNS
jgi:NADH:ubiquinone oxidoreductase subunit 2 (subunit N)